MFDDYLWKSYVNQTTFSNVKYQDLCETINSSKIEYLQNQKQSLKYVNVTEQVIKSVSQIKRVIVSIKSSSLYISGLQDRPDRRALH